jgi:hypothetical protein
MTSETEKCTYFDRFGKSWGKGDRVEVPPVAKPFDTFLDLRNSACLQIPTAGREATNVLSRIPPPVCINLSAIPVTV